VKCKLKAWNREVFRYLGESKARVLETIRTLDEKEAIHVLSEEDIASRIEAKVEFARLVRLEEIS